MYTSLAIMFVSLIRPRYDVQKPRMNLRNS
ncbi:hypothetical protein F383_20585 [Gossypium arboreum]|uniref:Uncharacterized protein n=1 Tax=Gossypium arboreum TaxID=29729 RepID=A0A0B0NNT6_GOSAR|nr:hypothetical protein F383_20585 [Gossypium arboreum]